MYFFKKSSEYFSNKIKDQLLKAATSQAVYREKFSLNLSSSSIISDCNMVDCSSVVRVNLLHP